MKKRFIIGVIAAIIMVGTVIPQRNVYADAIIEEQSKENNRADVIVTKYRLNNGVVQYRRWNETQGYWVDPEWINL